VAAGVAFPPHGLVLLLPLAIAAFALLNRGTTLRTGLLVGWLFGAAFMLTLLPWLRVIGTDAWIILSVFEGLFYGLLGVGTVVVLRLRLWPVWYAALWVGVDAVRSVLPLGGFPWGRLGFATAGTPVADLFAYVGSAGAGFAVALLGGVLAWAALAVRRAPVRATATLAATGLLVSVAAMFPWRADLGGRKVDVAAVQGNVPGEGMAAFAERRVVLDNHVNATLHYASEVADGRAPRPDLVVWPENSTDIDPYEDPSAYADIQSAVDAVGVPVLVGAMVAGPGPHQVRNLGIVWHPGAGPGATYAKRHPVPFGEYVPFRRLIAPYFTRLDMIPRDMAPGRKSGLLRINRVPVGDLICFEVAYDGLVRDVVHGGAGVVVVQTNNATYMGTGQVEQQFAIARLRAIETGRFVVVAATDGISGIVAPNGAVVQRAVPRTQQVLDARIGLGTGVTPGVRWGGLLEKILTLAAACAVTAGIAGGRRRRRPAQVPEPRPLQESQA
jgi:apolipoprotein N-acyltransferase